MILETVSPTASWAEAAARMPDPGARLPALSPAERFVAAHVAEGLSNREIAVALGKSEATVKHQVSAILRKAGVASRSRFIALLR